MSKQIEAMKRWVEVFDGNWHDEPVDTEWADRAHQALAEMRQAIAEAEQPAQQDLPDLIAGALGVSRGTAYDMMREALAEQQEPVAWVCEGSSSDEKHAIDYWPGDVDDIPIGTKLYTSPQAQPRGEATLAREPLTDERILSCPYDNSDMRSAFSEGWLKAEAAHGITKGNT